MKPAQIEGILTPTAFPSPRFDGQLALLIDAWIRKWRACHGSAVLTPDGIALGQLMFFRGDIFDRLERDDSYQPHLRISGRDELTGARKVLQRLLAGNPNAMWAIAHHLAAEAGGATSSARSS
ncbi:MULTISPECIES: hypothetical protein [unclassified Sphingobium]|uniref:hypothetical protein n=1 Tax=unclassified Sphingobium TaxID=2611147 RepID=UPI000D166294|nr:MULTISPECIES: hypothetical protein [unclassified Sphingobium]PSO12622.1 hypothetical protein C7E20_05810 [Sphingobium sp. AEW4]TWD09803.1 hypothetical protein FB595_104150 [Sphingobium sp. AEW010]TWD26474.1 hypothetical protein FB596_104150 [Sphingobium sp. AEW013]TWD27757.1 hypothetical protein FB594_105178 [Sphingobium sp. AEW001]